jgi:hypothetical protein
MEFGCSCCDYTSPKKEHVVRHINRKTSCGPGIREIIEIPTEIKCKFCNKNFKTKRNLELHEKYHCQNKEKILEEENRKLKEELEQIKKESKNVTINNNTTNNNQYNIIILNYEDTKSEVSDKTYNKLLKNSEIHKIIPNLIKHIHFNPNVPENHNIFISNKNTNNKHLQIYRNGHWEIANRESEVSNIIYDKETMLSDWTNEKKEKYPEAAEKFNEYQEQKNDFETSKLMKEEIEMLLYNNRHMTK